MAVIFKGFTVLLLEWLRRNFNLWPLESLQGFYFFMENSPNFCKCPKLVVTCVAVSIYEPLFADTL